MKLNKKMKITIVFISAIVIAYLIGNWIPIKYLVPRIKETEVNSSDYLGFIIKSISAFVTFLAVIVALFKEDIRKYWEFSKLKVTIPDNNIIELLNEQTSSSEKNSDIHLEAKLYNSRIEINNIGNIPAIGTELFLEKLEFTGKGYTNTQYIETLGTPINWNGIEKSNIIIPPSGKKLIDIVELTAPEKQSLPEGDKTTIPPKLKIGNVENPPEFKEGKWEGSFGLYSQNAKPVKFKVTVEWSGKWEKRLTEMKSFLKIEIKNN